MNYKIVLRFLSLTACGISFVFALSLAVGLFVDPTSEQLFIKGWCVTLAISIFLATVGLYFSRDAKKSLYRHEAVATVGLVWVFASLLGALPYYSLLFDISVVDALFESCAGVTTTGSSIFASYANFPKSLIFWHSISQWIGGLGVVVFFVAIISSLGASGKFLYSSEATASSEEIETSRVQEGVFYILLCYVALTIMCATAYTFLGMPWFEGLNFAFTTVSTGGFGVGDLSLASYQSSAIEWVAIVFMAIGGVSFFLILRICSSGWSHLWRNIEVNAYVIALIIISLLFACVLMDSDRLSLDWPDALRQSAFQVVSATSTGFTLYDYDLWPASLRIVLFFLVFLGACSGSTSGGFKVFRLMIFLKTIHVRVAQYFNPRVVYVLRFGNKKINMDLQHSVVAFFALYVFFIIISLIIISIFEPDLSLAARASCVISSLSNFGPGLEELGPGSSYAGLNEVSKVFLSLLMIAGRLELYAFLTLFHPALWRRF